MSCDRTARETQQQPVPAGRRSGHREERRCRLAEGSSAATSGMENDEPSIAERWPNRVPRPRWRDQDSTAARRTVWKTATGAGAGWQKAQAGEGGRPAGDVGQGRVAVENLDEEPWIMAAGVKRQLSHHEWPAWRQAWWMKTKRVAARSCRGC